MVTRYSTREEGRTSLVGVGLAAAALVAVGVTLTLAARTLDAAETSAVADSVPATSTTAPATPVTFETTTTTEPTPTTTTAPTTTSVPPTTIPPEPEPVSLRRGVEGPEVAALQARLVELGFFVPEADGHYGSVTAQAVMAFQKSAGLGRDGIAGPNTMAALETATPVQALEAGDHIEVDLERQLLLVVKDGRTLVLNTSTGRSGWRTPPGRFTITRQIDGMRHAPLGDLYRPKYFNGGIALHGSASIPGHPASHGCTRLHNAAVDHLWAADLAPVGTPVWVY